jgi:transposase-like protein
MSEFGRPASSAARRCCWRSASAGMADARLAPGADRGGRRGAARLAVELANRESRSSWRDFLLELRQRGLSGVEFVVSDDHAGLKQAIVEVLLIRALAVEMHENWLEAHRYLNMDDLREHKKEALRMAA